MLGEFAAVFFVGLMLGVIIGASAKSGLPTFKIRRKRRATTRTRRNGGL